VGFETKLADECIKEASPFIVVWVSKLKNNRNVRLDVYSLENCGGWRGDERSIILDGGCIRGGIDAGEVDAEKRVVFHVRHGRWPMARQRRRGAAVGGHEGGR
jgi:hypothetical protein